MLLKLIARKRKPVHRIKENQESSSNNKKVIVDLPDIVSCETTNDVCCISCDKPDFTVEYISETVLVNILIMSDVTSLTNTLLENI